MASELHQPSVTVFSCGFSLGVEQGPEIHIVMIGKARCGRSATGNTILGRKAFHTQLSSASPVTQKCQTETGTVDGQNLVVVDTPGLFGNTQSSSFLSSHVKVQEKVMEQIKGCVKRALPSPVFLVVLQLGSFTKEEQQTVKMIKRTFGSNAAHYTMALFTRGDDLKIEGGSIDELIGDHPVLRDFIRECRAGYHVFDNRDADRSQVFELLQKINSVVQRNGEHFNEEGKGDNSFTKACLGSAIGAVCIMSVLYYFSKT